MIQLVVGVDDFMIPTSYGSSTFPSSRCFWGHGAITEDTWRSTGPWIRMTNWRPTGQRTNWHKLVRWRRIWSGSWVDHWVHYSSPLGKPSRGYEKPTESLYYVVGSQSPCQVFLSGSLPTKQCPNVQRVRWLGRGETLRNPRVGSGRKSIVSCTI